VTTRREVLKLGAALSLAGMAPVTAVVQGLSVSIDAHSPEMLYLGKPMNYWLSRLNCCDHDPEFVDGVITHGYSCTLGTEWFHILLNP
jgi:hypothetical protein